jgi:hypothetical protein
LFEHSDLLEGATSLLATSESDVGVLVYLNVSENAGDSTSAIDYNYDMGMI